MLPLDELKALADERPNEHLPEVGRSENLDKGVDSPDEKLELAIA